MFERQPPILFLATFIDKLALDQVLQFSYIAGPVIGIQALDLFCGNGRWGVDFEVL
jgi:hypothetical protein